MVARYVLNMWASVGEVILSGELIKWGEKNENKGIEKRRIYDEDFALLFRIFSPSRSH